MDALLDSAYLMPFETRDLAQAYLATRQPDFKVGFLFSKQKTEQERAMRLDEFFADFKEKVTSQIDWHMKELFLTLLKENELQNQQLMADIGQFSVVFDKDLLISEVKARCPFNG